MVVLMNRNRSLAMNPRMDSVCFDNEEEGGAHFGVLILLTMVWFWFERKSFLFNRQCCCYWRQRRECMSDGERVQQRRHCRHPEIAKKEGRNNERSHQRCPYSVGLRYQNWEECMHVQYVSYYLPYVQRWVTTKPTAVCCLAVLRAHVPPRDLKKRFWSSFLLPPFVHSAPNIIAHSFFVPPIPNEIFIR